MFCFHVRVEKLNEVLPEYSVVFLVYVLAHAPFYTNTNNQAQFNRIKQCAFLLSDNLSLYLMLMWT